VTLPYLLRLACQCLACFFAVSVTAGLMVRWFSATAIRRAERLPAGRAARMLLVVRLFPTGFGLFCVIGFCIPSYLWLEPNAADEGAGLALLIAAGLGAVMWVFSLIRASRAAVQSQRYLRDCENRGTEIHADVAMETVPLLVIPQGGRTVALSGILRPRIIVSSEVVSALNTAQLDAALRHELAHHASRDNLKRFLILLAPGFLFKNLEKSWKQFSEWAADDSAVADDPRRAVELASALVCVARLRAGFVPPELATTLVGHRDELSPRVDRLLGQRPAQVAGSRRLRLALTIGIATIAALTPAALPWVHRVLERLMD
jgi:beta-lactamase regulating signal transducer with metallopeptidase domain